MEDTKLAYLAGFIDADGCIGIRYYKLTHRFQPYVVIVQKNPRVLFQLQEWFGGTIDIVRRGQRVYHRLGAYGKQVHTFLSCYPWLIEKREQAVLALNSRNHVEQLIRYRAGECGTQHTLSESEIDYRRSAWLKMKSLNTCHKSSAAAETKPSDSQMTDAIVRTSEKSDEGDCVVSPSKEVTN